MPKLTKKFIDSLMPQLDDDYMVWDVELRGFGIRVWPSGKKVYVLKYRTKQNRQRKYTIGAHGALTPEQARDLAHQFMAEIIKGTDPAQSKKLERASLTIKDLCARFLEEYSSKRHKPSTHDNYRFNIERWISPRVGHLTIEAVQRKDMIALHYAISNDAPQVANRVIAILSKMFNLAEGWGLRSDNTNPCRHVEKNAAKKKERYLNNDEIGALSRILDDARITQTELPSAISAIKLLLYTGCRLREILDLKWEYIDFDTCCFKLPDSKTGAKRVQFSHIVKQMLQDIVREPNNPYVIIGRIKGKQLNNLQKPWRRIRKLANLNDVRLHDLRHTFASIGAANGLSLPQIGALLGHSQPQTTARYAHLIGEPMQNAAMLVNRKIAEAMQHDKEQRATSVA